VRAGAPALPCAAPRLPDGAVPLPAEHESSLPRCAFGFPLRLFVWLLAQRVGVPVRGGAPPLPCAAPLLLDVSAPLPAEHEFSPPRCAFGFPPRLFVWPLARHVGVPVHGGAPPLPCAAPLPPDGVALLPAEHESSLPRCAFGFPLRPFVWPLAQRVVVPVRGGAPLLPCVRLPLGAGVLPAARPSSLPRCAYAFPPQLFVWPQARRVVVPVRGGAPPLPCVVPRLPDGVALPPRPLPQGSVQESKKYHRQACKNRRTLLGHPTQSNMACVSPETEKAL